MPDEKHAAVFASSRDAKRVILSVLRPAQCVLKVNKIAYAPNKGIRIEANRLDLAKLKLCLKELAEVRLKMLKNIKVNPRIIVHRVRNFLRK